MAKETKGEVGILFVRDMDRKLMHEFRGAAYMQGISTRDAIEDAMRFYLENFFNNMNKRLDAESCASTTTEV
jgi:hypothetical protein